MRAAALAVLLFLIPSSALAIGKVHVRTHKRGHATVHSYTRHKPHKKKHAW